MSPKKAIDTSCLRASVMRKISDAKPTEKPLLYFAGPWFDDEAESIMNYAEWLQNQLVNAGMNKYRVYFPRQHNFSTPFETFQGNIISIDDCDAMIALVSSKDVGTAYELGIATGHRRNIPVTLLGVDESTFRSKTNIMLAFCTDAYIGLDSLYDFLVGNPVESYKMTNTWEDKE